MPEPVIRVENLSKLYRIGARERYRTFREAIVDTVTGPFKRLRNLARPPENDNNTIWALKDVSFEVQQGEVLGIIGRNGAGKSTLLKILSRITEPTEGRVRIKGRVASLLEVGTGFHPEVTGRENIYLSGAILGMSKREIDRKLDQIVGFSGIEKFIDTPVKRYSSGMYVRLAFAVAAHLEPEILLVDEVLAVGDAAFQKKCLGKMHDVATGERRTVLFVSHNMSSIESLCCRCILLSEGRVAAAGPPRRVIEGYLKSLGEVAPVDVGGLPRSQPHYGAQIGICAIQPLYRGQLGFCFGDPLRFAVTLRSNVRRNGLRFGITITEAWGRGVLSAVSPSVIHTDPCRRVSYEIEIQDTRLAPGAYCLALSVGEGELEGARREYDVVNPGIPFAIASFSSDGAAPFRWERSYGAIVHPKCLVRATRQQLASGSRCLASRASEQQPR